MKRFGYNEVMWSYFERAMHAHFVARGIVVAAGVIALLIYLKWVDQRELIETKTHTGVVTEFRVSEETVQDRFGGGVRIQRYMHVKLPDGRRLVRMLPSDWEARHPEADLPGVGGLVWVREEIYNSGDPVLILDLSSLPTAP